MKKKGKSSNNFRKVEINHSNKIKNKRNIYIKIALLIVILISITFGISYAFYSFTIDSGEKKVEIAVGDFDIKFNEGNVVNLENTTPMSDSSGLVTDGYSFTIENKGTVAARYNLFLEEVDITNNTLDKKYIKYSLKEDNGEWSTPELLSNGLVLRHNRLLNVGDHVNYELKIWLTEEADNSVEGKRFNSKIVVSSVQNRTIDKQHRPIIDIPNTSINIYQGDSFMDPIPYEIKDTDGNDMNINDIDKSYEYFDGINTIEVNQVDTNRQGIYYIYYRITDQYGNIGCTVVSVNVCTKSNGNIPNISLNGDYYVEINRGNPYQELGVVSNDSEDGILEYVTYGNIDTNVIGEYIIKYVATDSNGNSVSIVRSINVI